MRRLKRKNIKRFKHQALRRILIFIRMTLSITVILTIRQPPDSLLDNRKKDCYAENQLKKIYSLTRGKSANNEIKGKNVGVPLGGARANLAFDKRKKFVNN